MIERDEIRDAKTVAAMYRAKLKNLLLTIRVEIGECRGGKGYG